MFNKDLEKEFEKNIGLVHMVVNRMNFDSVEKDDLFQAGCIGLWSALKNYKSGKGYFSTYAVPYILGEIKREIRNSKLIKVSRNILNLKRKLDLSLTVDENAKLLNVNRETILLALQYYESVNEVDNLGTLKREISFENLEYIEKKIITMFFLKNQTQIEISKYINIPQSNVSRIIKQALQKLRTEV